MFMLYQDLVMLCEDEKKLLELGREVAFQEALVEARGGCAHGFSRLRKQVREDLADVRAQKQRAQELLPWAVRGGRA